MFLFYQLNQLMANCLNLNMRGMFSRIICNTALFFYWVKLLLKLQQQQKEQKPTAGIQFIVKLGLINNFGVK